MRTLSIIVLSVLALSVPGCYNRRLAMVLQPGLSKPVPYVEKGSVIRWYDSQGADLQVTFLSGGSPCKEASPTAVCHVNVSAGIFNYRCSGCKDPVVPVGKNVRTLIQFYRGIRSASSLDPNYIDPVGITCDANGNALVDPQTVARGEGFNWFPTGLKPVTQWSFDLPGVCVPQGGYGDHFDQGRTGCTVRPDAPASAKYEVTVPDCKNTKTYMAQITIK